MSKFLIELPEDDDIDDLVGLMANFAKAEFRIVMTLETDCERLARAVAGLTGQVLTPVADAIKRLGGLITPKEAYALWGVDEAIEAQLLADAKGEMSAHVEQALAHVDAGIMAGYVQANGGSTNGRTCVICGQPAVKRSTICGDPECKKKRQKGWDAAWKEKHGKNVMPAMIVPPAEGEPTANKQEAAPIEPPLAGAGQDGTGSEISSSEIKWPAWAEFHVMSGALAGTFLTRKETQAMIGDRNPALTQLEAGTILLHRDGRKGRLELGSCPGIRFATDQPGPAIPGAEGTKAEKP